MKVCGSDRVISFNHLQLHPSFIPSSIGEADWKLIAINASDPWAALLNDVDDLETKLPGDVCHSLSLSSSYLGPVLSGIVHAIREWFRTYKIPDGKPENQFGLEGRCMNAAYAMHIVEETHEAWRHLVLGMIHSHSKALLITCLNNLSSPVLSNPLT
jgi:inorganic pyrophosphatase